MPKLRKESFCLRTSPTRKRYLCINTELLKNVEALLRQKKFEEVRKERMYENTQSPEECLVRAREMHVDGLQCTTLFIAAFALAF